jgi:hypothetical protein
MPHNNSYFAVFLTGFLLLGFHADGALAGEEVIAYESNKFTLGVGVGIVKFDTNAKVTKKASGRSRYIDLEGNLGLPELDQVNTFYGAYRFNEKHSMVFAYFSIDRDSNLVGFN